MIPEDHQLLPRVAHWITDIKRQMGNTIRKLVETEEHSLLMSTSIEGAQALVLCTRLLGDKASMILFDVLTALDSFDLQDTPCQSSPFQMLSHVIPLSERGIIPHHDVPACYRKLSNVRSRMPL